MAIAWSRNPPELPRRSRISLRIPCVRSVESASSSSVCEVRANWSSLTKAMSPVSISAAVRLRIGILSRTTVTSTSSSMPRRSRPSRTSEPRLPRSRRMISRWAICCPTTSESLMRTMRSPATTPALSLGPDGMTFSTITVSVAMLNTTPMPSNSPSSGSLISAISEAGM